MCKDKSDDTPYWLTNKLLITTSEEIIDLYSLFTKDTVHVKYFAYRYISETTSKSKTTVFKSIVKTTIASFDTNHLQRRHIAQNLLIWVDASIDESKQDCQNTLAQLQSVVNDVNIFTQKDQSIDFLTELDDTKAFLILEGTTGRHIVPLIHETSQLDAIYIFCDNTSPHEQWTKEWTKIKGVHTNIESICQAIELAVKQCNQDSIPVSFVMVSEEVSTATLNQLKPSFMYTQIFQEILLEMEHNEKSIRDLTNYCRELYHDNMKELNIINDFEHNYRSKSPIWWYTRECFTYQMLNRALRTLQGDIIVNMGFFIHDLHQQIQELYRQHADSYSGNSFILYRGQGFMKRDFTKLLETSGGLISFNNFLSTSKNRDVSLRFAKGALGKTDTVGVLFEMSIDPLVTSTPFASIREVSYYKTEEEVLFSMHTVFRIGEITKIDNNSSLYQVELEFTADDDQQLRTLTDRIRNEVVGETGWRRLSLLLAKIGQFDKAEDLLLELLEQTSDQSEKAIYYNDLGYVKVHQSDYKKAIWYNEKALEIRQKTLYPNHSYLANSYNSIGSVYNWMGEYSKALSLFQRALEISEKTVRPYHPLLAISYNNIAEVYKNIVDYSKVLCFYEKTLHIFEQTLPSNHPDLATSYNNIGAVYDNMGEYSKAVSCYEKALLILRKTLPSNHCSLATSYSNIGVVYNNMGEYSKAFSAHDKALEIRQATLSPNDPDLATSYNNIAGVYDNTGENSKALLFYEKALEIFQKTLLPNHYLLARSYNNLGLVYKKMGEYSKALLFYEKALEIKEKPFHLNHSLLAISYNNIGELYDNMKNYSKALFFYEKALVIFRKTLPLNHPLLAICYNNIGVVYNNMGEYPKAFFAHEKALEIRQTTLSPDHPDLATSYNNIGGVYDSMGEYSEALLFYERALEIFQKSVLLNHHLLARSYNNLGLVCQKMGEYSKALSFYEKSGQIFEKAIPPNYSDLVISYTYIAGLQINMKEYSKALSYFEQVLGILEHSLPPDHPDIQDVQRSIKIIKNKL